MAMLGQQTPAPFDPLLLHGAGELRRRGIEPTHRRPDGEPEYHQVRHGVWIERTAWGQLAPVSRHAAFIHATARRCDPGSDSIWSHESAAALWGMPRIEPWPEVAHATALRRIGSSSLIKRHECEIDAYLVHCGLRVTTPARTVVDLARTGSLVSGLAAADFALRHRLASLEEIADEVDLVPRRARGRVRATLVTDLADGRSMSAGESLSRAQMFVLNLPRPDLQVECTDEQGLIGYTDFGWPGVVGEFDGRVKYGVREGATADEAARALWAEKQREDRLRATGAKVARWVFADAVRPEGMARRLAQQGIRPLPRNAWFDLGRPPA